MWNSEQQHAIREYVVRAVTLILDNDEGAYVRIMGAARHAVLEGMDIADPITDYREAYAGRGAAYDRTDYAGVIGVYVRDELQDMIEESSDEGLARLLLIDLLDMGDSRQWYMFGEHYLPEPDDIEANDLWL